MVRPGAVAYRLKICLSNVRPPVWRRVEVLGDCTLRELHRVIQATMGWTDSHLHEFAIAGCRYGVADLADSSLIQNERTARLDELIHEEGLTFVYEYDLGDRWRHEILVEKIESPDPDTRYPVCSEGGGACPPEDCGGAAGYAMVLSLLDHWACEEPDQVRDWVSRAFDPEAFQVERANDALRLARARGRRADLAWLWP
jgi:hypothetical protein